MALTVVLALATSLVLSLTYVPAPRRASSLRGKRARARAAGSCARSSACYAPLLAVVIARPRLVARRSRSRSSPSARASFARAGSEFVPQLDEGDLVIQTTRAPDIRLETGVVEAGSSSGALLEPCPRSRAVVSRIGSPAVATDVDGPRAGRRVRRARSRGRVARAAHDSSADRAHQDDGSRQRCRAAIRVHAADPDALQRAARRRASPTSRSRSTATISPSSASSRTRVGRRDRSACRARVDVRILVAAARRPRRGAPVAPARRATSG